MVVIQEWWGLNGQIRSVAQRLANAGFTALVPDLSRGRHSAEEDEAPRTWRPRADWLLDATLNLDVSPVELDAPQLAGNTAYRRSSPSCWRAPTS